MDPLIPELTDDARRFAATMQAAAESGVGKGVMSYLFLRRGNMKRLFTRYEGWEFRKVIARVFTQKIAFYCGNNEIRVPATEYRRDKYRELQEIGARYGVALGLCSCKNPDVAEVCCHPLPQAVEKPVERNRTLRAEKSGNLFAPKEGETHVQAHRY